MYHSYEPRLRGGRRGSNIIEFSLLLPWYVFLFVGTYDFGFFTYSLIATQTAASAGATYCATNSGTVADATTACGYALGQLRYLSNVGSGITTCGTGTTVTTSAPVAVTASSVTGPDGNAATAVTVVYLTPQLIAIPGLLPANLTINRTVRMRIRG
jgi:Flp pilus assembly protein TadG